MKRTHDATPRTARCSLHTVSNQIRFGNRHNDRNRINGLIPFICLIWYPIPPNPATNSSRKSWWNSCVAPSGFPLHRCFPFAAVASAAYEDEMHAFFYTENPGKAKSLGSKNNQLQDKTQMLVNLLVTATMPLSWALQVFGTP